MHFDALTSGLESETHFRVEEKQIIAGRYVVIQYLGSGTFCHTVQCEDLQGRGQHRFVCVKVSKNTKDILDQNLWEVKLLKLPHDPRDSGKLVLSDLHILDPATGEPKVDGIATRRQLLIKIGELIPNLKSRKEGKVAKPGMLGIALPGYAETLMPVAQAQVTGY